MKTNIVEDIKTFFKNKTLNTLGVERDLYQLLADRDIAKAIGLMQDRDDEVDNALSEYNPQMHKVMHRPNKVLDDGDVYFSCKLPRNLQSYINEAELFFLLGQPILWKKIDGDDEAYTLYVDFLKWMRFDAIIRKIKRLAGAETESALVFHMYRDEDNKEQEIQVIPFVAARSMGYRLRPLFDQYGQMKAFAYGYALKENGSTVRHWDILTPTFNYYCKKTAVGWDVDAYPNITGKINAVYFQQNKAWFGAEPRLDRIEELDSKTGDTNNYFSDPIAEATADVIMAMSKPDKPGRLIQLTSDKSKFSYVAPPNGSESRRDEQANLKASVLFDTFTPDFDLEKMKGFGTLTGAAIRNTFTIGYLKRDNRKEDYENYVDRVKNVIIGILIAQHPNKEKELRELKIGFEFSDPFSAERESKWSSIVQLYGAGLMSLETAVNMLGLTDAPQDEINRIISMEMDKVFTANEAKGEGEQPREQQEAENSGEQQNLGEQ